MPPFTAEAEGDLRQALGHSGREEVVGFLLAVDAEDPAWFWRLRNYGEQPGVFALDELEVERVRRAAARRGERIVAFVHSHTSSLDLSPPDRRSQLLTRLPWLVVHLDGSELRWRLHRGARVLSNPSTLSAAPK